MIALQPWQLPTRALDDYAEYRRRGGAAGLGDWWMRYKDWYHAGDDEEDSCRTPTSSAGSRCSDNAPDREVAS